MALLAARCSPLFCINTTSWLDAELFLLLVLVPVAQKTSSCAHPGLVMRR